MIVEISPKKIIEGSVTVWNQPGPEVDIVMDPKNLTFRDGSVDVLYSFHVLDHLFETEAQEAVNNWRKCLNPKNGKIFVVVDDFEYLARAFVGGDIGIEEFNLNFTHPMNFTLEYAVSVFKRAGFDENKVVQWFEGIANYKREPFELLVSVHNGE